MKGINKYLLGILMVIPLAGMVSGQTGSRWAGERDQSVREAEVIDKNSEAFRVYRGGHFYVTDFRGADALRNGINEGYRQGFVEGEKDYQIRRYEGYRASGTFKDASLGYKKFI